MATRSTPAGRYPDRGLRRLALPPAVLAVIALLVGLPFLASGGFLIVRFAVAILALICGWFAIQARQWWWLPLLAAIAVLWNPIFPFDFRGAWWVITQFVGAVVFLVVGAAVRVRVEDAKGTQSPQRRR